MCTGASWRGVCHWCILEGWCILERGGMPLHDAVGINSKKCATTDIKAKGCVSDNARALSELT